MWCLKPHSSWKILFTFFVFRRQVFHSSVITLNVQIENRTRNWTQKFFLLLLVSASIEMQNNKKLHCDAGLPESFSLVNMSLNRKCQRIKHDTFLAVWWSLTGNSTFFKRVFLLWRHTQVACFPSDKIISTTFNYDYKVWYPTTTKQHQQQPHANFRQAETKIWELRF